MNINLIYNMFTSIQNDATVNSCVNKLMQINVYISDVFVHLCVPPLGMSLENKYMLSVFTIYENTTQTKYVNNFTVYCKTIIIWYA